MVMVVEWVDVVVEEQICFVVRVDDDDAVVG